MGLFTFLRNIFSVDKTPLPASIYDFKMRSLRGEEIDFSRYRGKKLLIVNTASRCRYTPQYEGLQQLHEQYGQHVTVLGFPANNFLWQEPGSNSAIGEFCQVNYGVTFQMFEKISVRGGDQHPLYRWLGKKTGRAPRWNFCKYLLDEHGNVVNFYGKKIEPLDKRILDNIVP